jgi:hypothetical protein
MKSWWLGVATALTLSGAALAQEAAAPTASVTSGCLAGLAPVLGTCSVVGQASLGLIGTTPVSWALYDIHNGAERSGLSVLLAPDAAGQTQAVARLPVSSAAVQDWVDSPYTMAGLVKRGEVSYAAMVVRGDEGPKTYSLTRADADVWTPIDAAGLDYAVATKLYSLTGGQCYVVMGDMNWRTFALRYDMMSDDGSCGTAFIDLDVQDGALKISNAMAVRQGVTPARRSRGRPR